MQAFSKHVIFTNLIKSFWAGGKHQRCPYSTFIIGCLDFFLCSVGDPEFHARPGVHLLKWVRYYLSDFIWYLSLGNVPLTEFCIIKLHSSVGVKWPWIGWKHWKTVFWRTAARRKAKNNFGTQKLCKTVTMPRGSQKLKHHGMFLIGRNLEGTI